MMLTNRCWLSNERLVIAQKQAQLDINSYINGLYNQLENQLSQVPLAEESLQYSTQLLTIIQTQQKIGQLDATSIHNAYISYTQAVSAVREIWSQVSSLALKLTVINKGSEEATDSALKF